MVVRRVMGYFFGKVKKTVRNYNVVERAEKSLDVGKRTASPHHAGTDESIQEMLKAKPEMQYESAKRTLELVEMLKKVKVSSSDSPIEHFEEISKPLPKSRDAQSEPHFGYEEPTIIPEGKCSLRQGLEFISNFQNDSNKWTIQEIANTYKLNPSEVENVVTYFKAFVINVDEKSKGRFSSVEVMGAQKVVYPKYTIDADSLPGETPKIDK